MQGYTTRCFIHPYHPVLQLSMGLTVYLIPIDPSFLSGFLHVVGVCVCFAWL